MMICINIYNYIHIYTNMYKNVLFSGQENPFVGKVVGKVVWKVVFLIGKIQNTFVIFWQNHCKPLLVLVCFNMYIFTYISTYLHITYLHIYSGLQVFFLYCSQGGYFRLFCSKVFC